MSKWSRIDVSDIDAKEIESNLCVYRETKRLKPDAMSDYVDAAMSSGNHLAFAQEFIDTFIQCGEYGLSYDVLMSLAKSKVEEYLSRKAAEKPPLKRGLSRERKKTVEMHRKLQALYYMKDTAWTSPSCSYPLDKLSRKKGVAAIEPGQKTGSKVLYSQDSLVSLVPIRSMGSYLRDALKGIFFPAAQIHRSSPLCVCCPIT